MADIWLIAGPPFDSAMWNGVAARLKHHGHRTQSWRCLTSGSGSLASEAEAMGAALDASAVPVVLVAHGTAVPLALQVVHHPQVSALVISNGQGGKGDRRWLQLLAMPVSQGARWIGAAAQLRALGSSAGLRRSVVNPYVMDHDTVVAVCGPILKDRARSARARAFLRDLRQTTISSLPAHPRILVCSGDAARKSGEMSFDSPQRPIDQSPIPGGRFMHPLERPWELADRIHDWMDCI